MTNVEAYLAMMNPKPVRKTAEEIKAQDRVDNPLFVPNALPDNTPRMTLPASNLDAVPYKPFELEMPQVGEIDMRGAAPAIGLDPSINNPLSALGAIKGPSLQMDPGMQTDANRAMAQAEPYLPPGASKSVYSPDLIRRTTPDIANVERRISDEDWSTAIDAATPTPEPNAGEAWRANLEGLFPGQHLNPNSEGADDLAKAFITAQGRVDARGTETESERAKRMAEAFAARGRGRLYRTQADDSEATREVRIAEKRASIKNSLASASLKLREKDHIGFAEDVKEAELNLREAELDRSLDKNEIDRARFLLDKMKAEYDTASSLDPTFLGGTPTGAKPDAARGIRDVNVGEPKKKAPHFERSGKLAPEKKLALEKIRDSDPDPLRRKHAANVLAKYGG